MSRTLTAIAALALSVGGCTSVGRIPVAPLASGLLQTGNGASAGSVVLLAAGDDITLNVAVIGLPPGTHGIHLHTAGRCEAPGFASAGGHLNPHAMQHGTANPAGSHLGDLPNLIVRSGGTGEITVKLRDSRATAMAALFDADGTAIVIHADPDDYRTDPSGNSGARIACAVLQRG